MLEIISPLDGFSPLGPQRGFNPLRLFANGEPGVWLARSDPAVWYQDAAASDLVTADGQSVRVALDKSQGLTGLSTMYRGLDLTPDYWIDAVGGDDGNTGTSEGTAWASLNKINTVPLSAGQTVTVRVKAGVYDKTTDLIEASQSATGAVLNIVFEPGCENDGAAYTTANSTGSFFSIFGDKHMNLYGNGMKVHGWTMGTGNGLGGNGGDANCSYDAYDFEIYNVVDGLSCHGNMVANYYDCLVYDCLKAAVAHIGGTVTTHTRCDFTEISGGGSAGVVLTDGTSADFTDCDIKPVAARAVGGTGIMRCYYSRIGTISTRVSLAGSSYLFEDSFVNISADLNKIFVLTRCFGFASFRQRNAGSLTMQSCVISGPASGLSNVFYSGFNPGSGSPHYIRNNIFETTSASAFMSYDATNAEYVVAAGSEFHNNILSGSAAFDADLIAADTGGTVIVDNVTADALIGAANTLDPDDYGYGAGSPAIGAATDGGNSGFAIGEVAAMTPQQVRGPDGIPGNHATSATPPTARLSSGVWHLEDDEIDDVLNWTAPAGDYTIAYVNSSGTVTILTAQALSGATDALLDPALVEYVAVQRALSAGETSRLTKYLESQVP